ncbi:MAG: F0F1 ATP synthase subunit A [Tistlia sp.]|uniref:F0F1 ATP synthase subunit A n=1 Tax=Tistlia sp. TaxID=3057121 RepID=UPI0034A25E5E
MDPLHQFEIYSIVPIRIGNLDLSFTNSALWMLITIAAVTAFFVFSTGGRALVPGRMQSVAELFYETIANMVRDNVGTEGRQYFPFIFTLFLFVLFGNVLGLIPSSFTFTSHIVVTFFMAIVIFLGVTVIGFVRHGAGYLRLFFPHGAPLWTAVILVPIELISYLSRPISLSMRLFANMMAGHILLKVFTGFVLMMGIAGVVPFAALLGITALELLVAVLQAYIFTILTCVYLHDAIHMH